MPKPKEQEPDSEDFSDLFYGNEEKLPVQTGYQAVSFSDRPDKVVFGKTVGLPEGEKRASFGLSLSKIEKALPVILHQMGIVDLPRKRAEFDRPQEDGIDAGLLGTMLHKAEIVMTMVLQERLGIKTKDMLPTMKQEAVAEFQWATDGIDILDKPTFDTEIETAREAVKRYFNRPASPATKALRLNIELPEREREMRLWGNEKFQIILDRFIRAFVGKALDPIDRGLEFNPSVNLWREAYVLWNLGDQDLQLGITYDWITKDINPDGSLFMTFGDLKTGKKAEGVLRKEIEKRQQQLLYVAGERFRASLSERKTKHKPGGVFFHKRTLERASFTDQVEVRIRRFNQFTGEMIYEPVQMTAQDLAECKTWLVWFIDHLWKYEQELRKALRGPEIYDYQKAELIKPLPLF